MNRCFSCIVLSCLMSSSVYSSSTSSCMFFRGLDSKIESVAVSLGSNRHHPVYLKTDISDESAVKESLRDLVKVDHNDDTIAIYFDYDEYKKRLHLDSQDMFESFQKGAQDLLYDCIITVTFMNSSTAKFSFPQMFAGILLLDTWDISGFKINPEESDLGDGYSVLDKDVAQNRGVA